MSATPRGGFSLPASGLPCPALDLQLHVKGLGESGSDCRQRGRGPVVS